MTQRRITVTLSPDAYDRAQAMGSRKTSQVIERLLWQHDAAWQAAIDYLRTAGWTDDEIRRDCRLLRHAASAPMMAPRGMQKKQREALAALILARALSTGDAVVRDALDEEGSE